MIGTKIGLRPEEVRFRGQHVLFVEGKDGESVDPKVLDALFEGCIRIEPLGTSSSMKGVAKALCTYHPTYYFLVDRDHHDPGFVNSCWSNFPDPQTHNLLMWRRREIENYFLEPSYLFHSRFCQVSQERLECEVLRFANERLFLDVSNQVIVSIREELKSNWIEKFTNPSEFRTKESSLDKLKKANEFQLHYAAVGQTVSVDEIERRFIELLNLMTGGQDELKSDCGNWIDMVQGKKVLAQVISSGCFKVQTEDGKTLGGRERINEVVRDLLRKDSSIQPGDFVELKKLVQNRIGETVPHAS